jgi:tRNA 2-selenouridine synthase
VLEDEGRMIGSNHLPECLRDRMAKPLSRWSKIRLTFVLSACAKSISTICGRIFLPPTAKKRAGRVQRVSASRPVRHSPPPGAAAFCEFTAVDSALLEQQRSGSTEAHFSWLVPLLNDYYDPMYGYQLEKKRKDCVSRTFEEVAEWLDR